MKKMRFL